MNNSIQNYSAVTNSSNYNVSYKGAIFDCFEKTLVKAFTKHKK